jgi:hypothetical protein
VNSDRGAACCIHWRHGVERNRNGCNGNWCCNRWWTSHLSRLHNTPCDVRSRNKTRKCVRQRCIPYWNLETRPNCKGRYVHRPSCAATCVFTALLNVDPVRFKAFPSIEPHCLCWISSIHSRASLAGPDLLLPIARTGSVAPWLQSPVHWKSGAAGVHRALNPSRCSA